jgi:hypothetical protein
MQKHATFTYLMVIQYVHGGYAVRELVETLSYKPKGLGFESTAGYRGTVISSFLHLKIMLCYLSITTTFYL